jgi:hypothetical protein
VDASKGIICLAFRHIFYEFVLVSLLNKGKKL